MAQSVNSNTQVMINCRNNKKLLARVKVGQPCLSLERVLSGWAVQAFDRHCNMVLENVQEMWTEMPKKGKGKKKAKAVHKDRSVCVSQPMHASQLRCSDSSARCSFVVIRLSWCCATLNKSTVASINRTPPHLHIANLCWSSRHHRSCPPVPCWNCSEGQTRFNSASRPGRNATLLVV